MYETVQQVYFVGTIEPIYFSTDGWSFNTNAELLSFRSQRFMYLLVNKSF